ncbi:MAG: hypothetical protein J6Q82_03990 [Clostridia bacterium]|nr:hypothetical protein [Clostridia bacterium]
MNFRNFFKSLLRDTSIYFTIMTALYSLGMLIVNVREEKVLLRADTLCFLFLFALLAALGHSVLRISSIVRAARLLLHYVILALSFYLCLLLPNGMKTAQVFVGLVLFTIVYWIGAGLVHIFTARFRKNSEHSENYEKQFQKKR